MICRAIDIGYGNVKFTISDSINSQLKTMSFPSEAIPTHGNESEIGGGFVMAKDIKEVHVCDSYFKVGVDSLLLDHNNVHRSLHDDYIKQKSYMALYLGALSYMNVKSIDILVVGLPVRLMESKEKELKQMLEGIHQIANGESIDVKNVKVIHQPLGGFLNFNQASGSNNQFLSSTNLIIDIGFYTMDWLVSKGLKPIASRCNGNHYGASKILETILKAVQKDDSLNTSIDNINYIDESILNGVLKIRGKSYPIENYIRSADYVIDEAIRDLSNHLKSTDDIQNIILSGGGAHFYKKALCEHFSEYDILIDEDSIFSNVKGFQIVGEVIARQIKKKAA